MQDLISDQSTIIGAAICKIVGPAIVRPSPPQMGKPERVIGARHIQCLNSIMLRYLRHLL